jgi:hypothetical protein
VAILLGPTDRIFLRFRAVQNMVGVIFDHIVSDRIVIMSAFRPWLNEYVGHRFPPDYQQ